MHAWVAMWDSGGNKNSRTENGIGGFMYHIHFHYFVPQTFLATGDKILTKAGKVPNFMELIL